MSFRVGREGAVVGEDGLVSDEGGVMGHRRDHEWLETFEGAAADRYDRHSRWLRGLHARTASRLAALVPPGGRLLDVGCGPGRLLAEVAALRPDVAVTGLDVSERMVELATSRLARVAGGRGRVVRGDVHDLPLAGGSADVVTAVLTAHHWDDLRRSFAEVARVLAPGGSVLVVEMRGPARHVARTLGDVLGVVPVRREAAWVVGLPLLTRLQVTSDGASG